MHDSSGNSNSCHRDHLAWLSAWRRFYSSFPCNQRIGEGSSKVRVASYTPATRSETRRSKSVVSPSRPNLHNKVAEVESIQSPKEDLVKQVTDSACWRPCGP